MMAIISKRLRENTVYGGTTQEFWTVVFMMALPVETWHNIVYGWHRKKDLDAVVFKMALYLKKNPNIMLCMVTFAKINMDTKYCLWWFLL